MQRINWYELASDDSDIYTAIGTRLRYYRGVRGMSQTELAAASGVSRSTIGKIERHNNTGPYSIRVFIALARALHTSLECLVSDRMLS